jgi:hypothetical protein
MRELVKSYEVWNHTSERLDHTIIVWKEGDNYYQSEHSATNGSFDIDSLPVTTPIPMHIFQGTLGSIFNRVTFFASHRLFSEAPENTLA